MDSCSQKHDKKSSKKLRLNAPLYLVECSHTARNNFRYMAAREKHTQVRLGKKIQKLRKLQDFTQESFAERLHISRTHISHIEQGRAAPSLKLLTKIARALKIPVRELL